MGKAAGAGAKAPWVGLAALVLFCPSVWADDVVRFRTVADRLVVVPVRVNGQGPFDFLLDTGTNTTVLDLELAQQLGLSPVDRVSVVGPGSVRVAPRALLRSLTLGPMTVEGAEALCDDLGGIRRLDHSIRGLLGQQFLSRFNYLLSYKDRRIEFVEPEAPGARLQGVAVPFEEDEGRMVVPVVTSSTGTQRRLVLDSGASDPVLFDGGSDGRTDVEEHEGAVAGLTAQGARQFRTGSLRQLVVGGQRFDDLTVVLVADAASGEGRAEDGLLPTSLFRAVYVNNREGVVLLNPRR